MGEKRGSRARGHTKDKHSTQNCAEVCQMLQQWKAKITCTSFYSFLLYFVMIVKFVEKLSKKGCHFCFFVVVFFLTILIIRIKCKIKQMEGLYYFMTKYILLF